MSEVSFRNFFRPDSVDGDEKVVCTVCDRVIRKHTPCMRWHFAMHERQGISPTPHQAEGNDERSGSNVPPLAPDAKPPRADPIRTVDRDDVVKRTVKYLAVCSCTNAIDAVLRAAPDEVIEATCDAAYNVHEGPVTLTESQKDMFRDHESMIEALASPSDSIETKREAMESQTGGFAFLPILISAALGALGSRLFGGS